MKTVYISSDKAARSRPRIVRPLFCTAVLMGFMLIFTPFLGGRSNMLIAAGVGLGTMAASIVTEKQKFLHLGLWLALFMAAAVLFGPFSGGMREFINDIIYLLNSRFNLRMAGLLAESYGGRGRCVFFSLIFAAAAMLLSRFSRRSIPCFGVGIFLIFEFFAVLQVRQNPLTIAAAGTAAALCWMKPEREEQASWGNLLVAGCSVACAAMLLSAAASGFGGFKAVASLEKGMEKTLHNVRYGVTTLPEGDMHLAGDMNKGGRKALEVTSDTDGTQYLGGFIGADFSSGRWRTHTSDTFTGEWDGIFRWLEQQNFSARLQHGVCAEINGEKGTLSEVTVKNTGTDRYYLYLPHTLKTIDSRRYKMKDDLEVHSTGLFGAGSYSFTQYAYESLENEILHSSIEKSSLSERNYGYFRVQSVYSGFVKSVYLNVDEDTADKINEIFFDTEYISEESSLYSVVARIRAVMELRCSFSEAPDLFRESDDDFVSWFLSGSKKGNSAYFATAGALALRCAGFPSRYTEGYRVDTEGGKTAAAAAKNAHAWAEVYLDGIGWIPVEFTPGFYSDSVLTEQTVEISKESAGGEGRLESPYTVTEELPPEEEAPAEEEPKKDPLSLKAVIELLGALILGAALVITGRMGAIRGIRRKRFKESQAERSIYAYIFKMLALGGVSCDSSRPEECAEAVHSRFKEIRTQEYRRMVSIMQKSVFGGAELKGAEIRSVRLFAES